MFDKCEIDKTSKGRWKRGGGDEWKGGRALFIVRPLGVCRGDVTLDYQDKGHVNGRIANPDPLVQQIISAPLAYYLESIIMSAERPDGAAYIDIQHTSNTLQQSEILSDTESVGSSVEESSSSPVAPPLWSSSDDPASDGASAEDDSDDSAVEYEDWELADGGNCIPVRHSADVYRLYKTVQQGQADPSCWLLVHGPVTQSKRQYIPLDILDHKSKGYHQRPRQERSCNSGTSLGPPD